MVGDPLNVAAHLEGEKQAQETDLTEGEKQVQETDLTQQTGDNSGVLTQQQKVTEQKVTTVWS